MKTKIILLLLLFTIIFLSCTNNKCPSLVNTVYMDTKGCFHVDRNCPELKKNYAAIYININDLKDNRLKCTACISDNDSRKIDSIIEYNIFKTAYSEMKDNYYNVPDNFKEFLRQIKKDDKYANWVYNFENFGNYDTYNEFRKNLNLTK